MRAAILLVCVGLALVVAPGASGMSGSGRQPLHVRSASLTQRGRQLVWQVELDHAFSPRDLKRNRRSLCLLIRRRGGPVSGVLCVEPPRGRAHPRLRYMPVTAQGRGPGRVIAAAVTRASDRELTASFLPADVGVPYRSIRWQVLSTLAPPACRPAVPNPDRCTRLFPTRPPLTRLHNPQPVGCVPAGPSLVYSGPSNRRVVALTFDDGPWPDPPTSQFLDVLERKHAVATFFEIGNQISEYDHNGALERRMLADGDMIGDHTFTHPDMAALSPGQQTQQLEQTAGAIRGATGGFTPCLWRPPYGYLNSPLVSLARSLGFLTIDWDIDTSDYSLPGTGVIYQRVLDGAHNGAIILQHFGGGPRYETLAALPGEIDTLRSRGYRFVTVDQLLGLRLIYR